MKLGIMQPYFFPYLGHFALIEQCDRWIVFDITQYTPKTWMSRNRVLHPKSGWNYISVPLANASISIKTAQAEILSFNNLLPTLLGKLSHYRRRAPFYESVQTLVLEVFAVPTKSLVALNVRALKIVCEYLGIRFNHSLASSLQMTLPEVQYAGGWAVAISQSLGALEYINPISGRSIFRSHDFEMAGVTLKFLDFGNFVYPTDHYKFQPALSILDVMMWNEPAKIRRAISQLTTVIDVDDAGIPS